MKHSKILALLGAAVLSLGVFGIALASTPASDQGVVPTFDSDNVTLDGNGNSDKAACANIGTEENPIWDGLETGDTGGSGSTPDGTTVTWTYDGNTKEFGFSATGGLVTIAYVKGGKGYNAYDYSGKPGGGVSSDGGMFAPDTNGDGQPQGLSHAVFCTTPTESEPTPSFESSQEGATDAPTPSFQSSQEGATECPCDTITGVKTSGPADGAWLLVVALGLLLASIVVLTPARAKGRR